MSAEPTKGKNSEQSELTHFIQHSLPAISEAFAASPLMQLRVTTDRGSVTLVKSAPNAPIVASESMDEPRTAKRMSHDFVPDGEPGRAYDTVAADVVGVFHAAPDLPDPGQEVASDRVLGYIEALKLRTPVKAGFEGRLVGQVAEEGQAVDFGETLFIIDSGGTNGAPEVSPAAEAPEAPEVIEPPRI